ncbi:MarR family transcriptional regulator [uncultured Paracoccus sp.]|uniref:MarR family winged helix-turn-helix transcriptional regulator n=1 Tax=uncultured Paracoccus sp. TaxID=189685 RepID=UPI002617FC3D|nr:MarR family transcriptional regulator [uncultured Paracoccus sp.]HMR36671.1 MarR family transcriptional regulator [Paracoccus sp. (in: a-proteobacteria)]
MTLHDTQKDILRKISMAGRQIRKLFNARASEYGLTLARAQALILLREKGAMTQADLAMELEVERPTVARLVDAMVAAGHVTRETSESDRRYRNIALTDAANGDIRALEQLTAALREDVLADISASDLSVVNRVFTQMLRNIEQAR